MLLREACYTCAQEILVIDCFDGRRRTFALVRATDPATPQVERWLVRRRDQVAVHGGVTRTPITDEWLVRHRCKGARREGLASIGDLLDVPGSERPRRPAPPPASELPDLDDSHLWAYQWFDGVRHILSLERGRSMCGKHVDRYDDRDRERMQQMTSCRTCVHRWETWRDLKPDADGGQGASAD